jgi:oxygen-independent coproporphyrinogen-3 oxidase
MHQYGDDDAIYTEFDYLREVIMGAGYERYELSSFALAGQASIHNHVYRSMQPYLGLGTSASSLLYVDNQRIRQTNTRSLKAYLADEYVDDDKTQILTPTDVLIEQCFLALRTRAGVSDLSVFESVLVDNHSELIADYIQQ